MIWHSQVETIGDCYECVSGAPIVTKFHAVYIADMALDMLKTLQEIPDPSTGNDEHIQMRIGMQNQSINQSFNRSINRSINQSINQTVNQSINQLINQS